MKTTESKRKIPTSLLIKELKTISRDFAQEGNIAETICVNSAIIVLLKKLRESKRRTI